MASLFCAVVTIYVIKKSKMKISLRAALRIKSHDPDLTEMPAEGGPAEIMNERLDIAELHRDLDRAEVSNGLDMAELDHGLDRAELSNGFDRAELDSGLDRAELDNVLDRAGSNDDLDRARLDNSHNAPQKPVNG